MAVAVCFCAVARQEMGGEGALWVMKNSSWDVDCSQLYTFSLSHGIDHLCTMDLVLLPMVQLGEYNFFNGIYQA